MLEILIIKIKTFLNSFEHIFHHKFINYFKIRDKANTKGLSNILKIEVFCQPLMVKYGHFCRF